MHRLAIWIMGCVLAAGTALGAQSLRTFDPATDVGLSFKKGAVVLTVPQGAHLKAQFMEIALKPGVPGKLKVGPIPPTPLKDELGDGIWRDRVAIPIAGEGLPASVELVVTYQPCTEGSGGVCFQPTDRDLVVKGSDIPALGKAESPKAGPAEMPSAGTATTVTAAPASAVALPAAEAPGAAQAPPATTPPPGGPVAPTGLFWVFLGVFAAGLGASLTPCVYPMIPITMAIIGAKGGGKARGFMLSLSLVLGMAVTYTTLGVVAARTGAIAGALAQSPKFLIPVSVLFALFALSLFGVFEISLPQSLQARLQGSGGRKGLGGAFLMGLVLGPLSAPCVGPVIGTVLVAIGQDGRVLLGAAELFVFALGMGVLFMAVGVFSAALPRSGNWLVKLKQGMGIVVLGFAAWNVRLVVPDFLNYAMWTLVLLLAAAVLDAFQGADDLASGLRKGLGLLAVALALVLGVKAVEKGLDLELLPRGATAAPAAKSAWLEQDLEGALAQAKAGGKLVLVDTYADWCAQCKELDEKTWPDAQVAAWIKENAVPVRIDTYKVRKDLTARLAIVGYPTVILLDGNGKEVRRSAGFLKPAEMLKFLKG